VVFKLAERPLFRAEMVIWQFAGGLDGGRPTNTPTFDADGNLYGTTAHGGSYDGLGTVFKVAASGNSSFSLLSFGGAFDGAQPYGNLIVDLAGNLYGTTFGNGSNDGTVFKIAPNGAVAVLHTFQYKDGGALPLAGLTADSNGNLSSYRASGPNVASMPSRSCEFSSRTCSSTSRSRAFMRSSPDIASIRSTSGVYGAISHDQRNLYNA
jgi:uncharacterized repeat protein (TIGR03803 family)